MKTTPALFLFKGLIFLLPVLVFFEILFRMGYAPVVTNSTLFDIKMLDIQKRRIKKTKIISLGSSITLYELNSGLIVDSLDPSYYNFASWGLQLADMKNLLPGFVKDTDPGYVIICSSPGDFVSPQNDSYFNYINTPDFIKNNFPEFFYFKNYNSIHQIIRRKIKAFPLKLDDWGGASLEIKAKDLSNHPENGLLLFPTSYTNENYNNLDSIASFLKNHQIKLIFIQAPLKNSSFTAPILQAHFSTCRQIVEAQNGIYLNYNNPAVFPDSLFIDQFHLLNEGSVILTNEIVSGLKKIIK
jgi:hypothetical protein